MRLFSRKQNPVGGSVVLSGVNYTAPTRDLNSFIKEGYKLNVIIYRCIEKLVQAIASAEIEVHKGENVLEKHWVLDLLKRPNPTESGAQFIRHIFTDYLIGGNMYIAQSVVGGKPKELWAIDPRYMQVQPGAIGLPLSFKFDNGSFKKTFPVDQVSGRCDVFHYKKYDPENIWVGMSPMQPAAMAGDAHNDGMRWNSALLKNGARPSGVIRFKGTPSAEVISKITEFFTKRFYGAGNAGKVPILPNEAEWQQIDQSPKDMDFIAGLKEYAKYIALAYDIPLPLTDNDSSSYNNIEQAKELLWTDTALPLLSDFLDAFGNWLFSLTGENDLTLSINMDNVAALEGVRERRFKRMGQGVKDGLITPNEAREAIDYTPIPGAGDSLFVPSTMIPIDMADDMNTMPNDQSNQQPDSADGKKHHKWLLKVMEPVGVEP